jgi:hypothetical protein
MKDGSESGALVLLRSTFISLLKAFLSRIILNRLPETIKAIGQGLLVFGLGKDSMHVANVPVAPDALV